MLGVQQCNFIMFIFKVLVSIQSLILVPDPFFNEPGYEHWIGSEYGNQQSTQYNQGLHHVTLPLVSVYIFCFWFICDLMMRVCVCVRTFSA